VDTAGYPFYLGLYSNLNMIIWGFATGVLWFTYWMIRQNRPDFRLASFILASAVTTTILYLDDFFQLHERVFPDYLGIPQLLVFTVYAAWIIAFLAIYIRTIRMTDSFILFSALAFFGLSFLIDLFQERMLLPGHHLWEDGLKCMGIVGWSAYFIHLSFISVKSLLSRRPA
jgi:hypothetical protein